MATPSLLGSAPARTSRRILSLQPRLLPSYPSRQLRPATRQTLPDLFSRPKCPFSSGQGRHSPASASTETQDAPPPRSPPPAPRRTRTIFLTAIFVAVGTVYWAMAGGSSGSLDDNGQRRLIDNIGLNQDTFVPFEIVGREEVSPTAFVLTLRLPSEGASSAAHRVTRDVVAAAWRHGLWSVEVRQPQLQIARDYTPLPHIKGDGAPANGTTLRLFVRTVQGGEISKYLSRQAVGSTIDVRGPRLSFDVTARLGDSRGDAAKKRVVVLAGGTGMATALQAAHIALGKSNASVSILWANRLPHDSTGLDVRGPAGPTEALNPIVRSLRALQTQYGADRVSVQNFVDGEPTCMTDKVVQKAMVGSDASDGGSAWYAWPWWKQSKPTHPTTSAADATSPICVYHSAQMLEQLDADAATSETASCSCSSASPDADGQDYGYSGKNLILVSGPEGWIAAWAGAKAWAEGKERQGPLNGILGHMAARDAETFNSWQVLKL